MPDLTCPYCNGKAVLVHSSVVYPGSDYGNLWVCENYPECDSYVGCRRFRANGDEPLGSLANAELREARKRAHAAFDPLWQSTRFISRSDAYRWLSEELEIPENECHIGMFDVSQCRRVCESIAGGSYPIPF